MKEKRISSGRKYTTRNRKIIFIKHFLERMYTRKQKKKNHTKVNAMNRLI